MTGVLTGTRTIDSWTVTITEIPGRRPAHGDRGHTHRIVAIDARRERVIQRTVDAAAAAAFDPDTAWSVAMANRRR